MSVKSNIEWTDATWNPVTGCAETFAERWRGVPGNYFENGFDLQLRPAKLEEPLRWKKPRRVFVNSMSDLFHEAIPDDYIDKVFAVMALTPQHTYQVLTKRPERMREYMTARRSHERRRGTPLWFHLGNHLLHPEAKRRLTNDPAYHYFWPLPNVWLGVTAENQRWSDERIPVLLDTPAAVRFVSCEPLLGEITMYPWLFETPGVGLDWVIVGGESGPRHRRFDPDWARSIVAQCREAGTACFVKQLGGARPGNALEDLPEDLRVREWPR